jgi:hypothetical protein
MHPEIVEQAEFGEVRIPKARRHALPSKTDGLWLTASRRDTSHYQ